jgi:hypothetical protein
MLYLPRPYEDELLYSVFARHFAYTQPREAVSAYISIAGSHYVSIKYGRNLQALADDTAPIWALSADDIVERHTMLPFYGSFLAPDVYENCRRGFLGGGKAIPTGKLGLNNSNIKEAKRLRFCSSCAAEDLDRLGETYWRRTHQMTGALVCTVHGEVLCDSEAGSSANFSKRFQDATQHIRIDDCKPCVEFEPAELAVATELSERCASTLSGEVSRWMSPGRNEMYRQYTIDAGYTHGRKKVETTKLGEAIVERFGPGFLGKVGFKAEANHRLFCDIYSESRGVLHPLVHVLVQMFLERLAETGSGGWNHRSARMRQTDWKCPNPYYRHDADFRLPHVVLRRSKDRSEYLHARCECGFVFAFRGASEADPSMPEISRTISCGPAFEAEAKRLFQVFKSINGVAKAMDVERRAVRRLLSGRKSAFEAEPGEIVRRREEWRTRRSRPAYQYLLRNDRTWILAQEKLENQGNRGPRAKPVEVDEATAAAIRTAAAQLLELDPPRRITIRAICLLLDDLNLYGRILKTMPVAAAAMAGVTEPQGKWLAARSARREQEQALLLLRTPHSTKAGDGLPVSGGVVCGEG